MTAVLVSFLIWVAAEHEHRPPVGNPSDVSPHPVVRK